MQAKLISSLSSERFVVPELFIGLNILTVGFNSYCYWSPSNSTLNLPACIKCFITYLISIYCSINGKLRLSALI